MYGRKRGGSVQVNMMQYQELVERVERLESLIVKDHVEQSQITETAVVTETVVLTKIETMTLLDEKGIKYNPRDKKGILIELLEGVA